MERMLQIEELYSDKNPLAYSVEELQAIMQQFEDEYVSGNFVGIPLEEVMKEYDFLFK